jgi:hypothetical protein
MVVKAEQRFLLDCVEAWLLLTGTLSLKLDP